MATSDVQICSNALLMLGQETIASFTEGTERSTKAANLWANSRDAVLRSHPWNCAVKRVTLAADVVAPAYGFVYAHSLPGDLLRVLDVGAEDEGPYTYRIESRKLLCDDSPIPLRYVWQNTDVTTYDPLLVHALELYMAAMLAYPMTHSTSLRESMLNDYQAVIRSARSVDGQEEPHPQVGDSPLIQARFRRRT
jgi:hypothetical protein